MVKWNSTVTDKASVLSALRLLFSPAAEIPGVSGVRFIENCVDRPNRYDLAILIGMERSALPLWDACEVHKRWKSAYGDKIEAKAIFDFE